MAAFKPDTVNVKGLQQMINAVKKKPPVTRVGVLGSHDIRNGKSPSNAEIAAAHEYGSPARNLPQRSFLRVPIADKLQSKMSKKGALSENEFKEVLKQESVVPWMKKIAVLAEEIVQGAFDTQGYGKWPGWKNENYTNNAMRVLEDTGQLRDSITSDVKE